VFPEIMQRSSFRAALWLALLAFAPASPTRADSEATASARRLLLTGHYAEARQAYQRLASAEPADAAIGLARCQREVGEIDEAARGLTAALAKHSDPALHAELAWLEFERGARSVAQAHVDSALARAPDQPLARWIGAELDRVAGRLDDANEGYRWFIRFYNDKQDEIRDAETLLWIGQAAAQYARWNRNSGQFHFLVNTLYPDALQRDASYWPAHLEAALLFIEKYNPQAAAEELDTAFQTNPHAAELHAARARIALLRFDLDSARVSADRALAIDPRLLPALLVQADAQMIAVGPGAALPALEKARALDPTREETLGRLAAIYGTIDGLKDDAGSRMGAVIAEAVKRNEHCGEFFATLGSTLDLLRRYPYAAKYYEEARRRMPQLYAVHGQLGMVAMRLGDEVKARPILKDAFEADPFNVRVKNSLDVLEVLAGYRELTTDHFVIRFDAQDSLLAAYAARRLEDVYPVVVKDLGYAPPEKSLFEIFNRANGQSGHRWFSTRMVGMPFIGTVGACAGKMVAVTSPNDGQRFNWARVLKHEFVHVVNLQQTGFNIPHWYTEALAVTHEGETHPRDWDAILSRRAAADRLFDLDDINFGFQRPTSAEDWALAYYQAFLYARYMTETYGPGANAKMLAAYAGYLDTPAALKKSFGVTKDAFEKGYRAYVMKIAGTGERGAEVGTSRAGDAKTPSHDAAASLERAIDKNPRDADLQARLARVYLDEGRPYQARSTANRALEIDPKQPKAAFVIARVNLLEGAQAQALAVLKGAFDAEHPDGEALALLLNLTIEAKDFAETERLAALGAQRFPGLADWDRGLIAAYRETKQTAKLEAALARRAEGDPDDFETRAELMRLAVDRNDEAAAGRWALEAMQIDVRYAPAHAALARAEAAAGRRDSAIGEYEAAVMLAPDKHEWRVALAREYAAAGRKDRARAAVDLVLQKDAQFPGAKELRESLGR
jgi:cellulose synthase operon protein C